MTYFLCINIIKLGKTDGLIEKLDAFLLNDRISKEQYNELVALISSQN